MNIILIVIDTLRYDYIGAHGNEWIKTPNLDRLAARSWVFDRAFSASFPTIPHRTDVMTGRYGGPFHPWRPLRHDAVTFPEELGKAGYCTQLIHDTPHLVNGGHNFDWPFHAWTPIRGAEVDRPWLNDRCQLPSNWARDPMFDFIDWDKIYEWNLFATYARSNRKRQKLEDWNTAQLFLTASEWLRDNARRDDFFLWVDCFDPHEPWDVPPEFATLYDKTPGWDGRIDPCSFIIWQSSPVERSEQVEQRVRALYGAKVSWVDHWLGKFLDTLDETGLARNTAILLTADHGTNVGEYGRWGKQVPVREGEGHVPFMVATPDGDSGRSDMLVQPQDVFATIMNLAGQPVPQGIESHDVLTIARQGGPEPRQVALAGSSADRWLATNRGQKAVVLDAEEHLFTVFDKEWFLEAALNPEDSRLTRLGTLENIAARHPDVVTRLHAAGLAEIARRGIDPKLLEWLQGAGEKPFPGDCRFWDGWPGPAGFMPYFQRLYHGWRTE